MPARRNASNGGATGATRQRAAVLVLALALSVPLPLVQADHGAGKHFGADNIPPGCSDAHAQLHFLDDCYHMYTDALNLDTPTIDVLILPPASPVAAKDLTMMRQAVDMWDQGIDYLARDMGMDWLADGVTFNIVVHNDSTPPLDVLDPEIVIVAVDPLPTATFGVATDPLNDVLLNLELAGIDAREAVFGDGGACDSLPDPLASEDAWRDLPGFDGHHNESGTYTVACEDRGTVCFAVNLTGDVGHDAIDAVTMFDLVAHEVGHCLSLGHVGDALEFTAEAVPYADVMSYTDQVHRKCASTLDVEVIAVRMSRFLLDTPLEENDPDGPVYPYHVQHPDDHAYASSTGRARDCPQPDPSLTFLERADFTPTPVAVPTVAITAPTGNVTAGPVTVTGTVDRGDHVPGTALPSRATYADDPADGVTPVTELLAVTANATATTLEVDLHLDTVWPVQNAPGAYYTATVDGRTFTSYLAVSTFGDAIVTTDDEAGTMDDGTSTWDRERGVVSFHLPLSYLEDAHLEPPHAVHASANAGPFDVGVPLDHAPPPDAPLRVSPDRGGERVEVLVQGASANATAVRTDATDRTASWSVDVDLSAYPDQPVTLEALWYDVDERLVARDRVVVGAADPASLDQVTITSPAHGDEGTPGRIDVRGTVTRGADPVTADILEDALVGSPGDVLRFDASVAGSGVTCAWSLDAPTTATFVGATDDCAGASVVSTSAGNATVRLTATGVRGGSVEDAATASWVDGGGCIEDPTGDAAFLVDDPTGLYDLDLVCARQDATFLNVTISTAATDADRVLSEAMSPVQYRIYVDDGPVPFDVGHMLGESEIYPYDTGATTAWGDDSVTVSIPLSALGGSAESVYVETWVGEGFFVFSLAGPLDRAPGAGAVPVVGHAAEPGSTPSPTDGTPGTERVQVYVDGTFCAEDVSLDTLAGKSTDWGVRCTVAPGDHVLSAYWYDADDALLATHAVTYHAVVGGTQPSGAPGAPLLPLGDLLSSDG